MTEHAVVIAGAGPTGLVLAAELALAGVDVAIVERRPDQRLAGSRAGGLSSRTLEVFDQRGIVDRFLAEGQIAQVTGFAVKRLDISDFPTRHNHGLALRQKHIERILAGWVGELAVPIHRGREVTSFVQDETGVTVELSEGAPLRARYLVGCDGGRSLVRKTAGIEFAGWDATTSSILAEAEMAEEPPLGVHRTALGIHAFGREVRDSRRHDRLRQEGPIGVMVTERHVGATADPRCAISGSAVAACGTTTDPQPDLDLQVHRHVAAGVAYRRAASLRRCRTRALPGRRTRPQHRRAGRSEPGLEAGPGGERNLARRLARHLSRRAASGRGTRAAHDHGTGRIAAH